MNRDRELPDAKPGSGERGPGREAGQPSPWELHLLAKGRLSQAGQHLRGVMADRPERESLLLRPDLIDTPSHRLGPTREAEIRALREYGQAFEGLAAAFTSLPAAQKRALVPRGITLISLEADPSRWSRPHLHWDSIAKGLEAHELEQALTREAEEADEEYWMQPTDELETSSSKLVANLAGQLEVTKESVADFISTPANASTAATVLNQAFGDALANGDRTTMKALAGFLLLVDEPGQPSLLELFKQQGVNFSFC